MIFFCVPRYLKRATSSRWPLDDGVYGGEEGGAGVSTGRPVTRTQSCPVSRAHRSRRQVITRNNRDTVATIPVTGFK